MIKAEYQVVIVGCGAAGLAAAISARREGAQSVLLIDREIESGGILMQCIHSGFGLGTFGEDLPGPSYAQRQIDQARSLGVEFLLDATVIDASSQRNLWISSFTQGLLQVQADALVLAMGCRERTRAQINLPGTRPPGVYTAGLAQRLVNIEGYLPGRSCVILGSGDIGMIMARRLTYEGVVVKQILEIMPYVTGLMRNYVQCVLDYAIPLKLCHTVNRIIGQNRVEAVETGQVDASGKIVPGTQEVVPCDTLLLSVGLIPENELSRQIGIALDPFTGGPFVYQDMATSMAGIFAAGNVVHVYDLVDWVTQAGFIAGRSAARFAAGKFSSARRYLKMKSGNNIRYVIPQYLDPESLQESEQSLQVRVIQPVEQPVQIQILNGRDLVAHTSQRYVRPGELVLVAVPQSARPALQSSRELEVRMVKGDR
jgi:NADPH-dependent 2,4-dienoyl-CoA reductase/sulfur reductase-like enzyme